MIPVFFLSQAKTQRLYLCTASHHYFAQKVQQLQNNCGGLNLSSPKQSACKTVNGFGVKLQISTGIDPVNALFEKSANWRRGAAFPIELGIVPVNWLSPRDNCCKIGRFSHWIASKLPEILLPDTSRKERLGEENFGRLPTKPRFLTSKTPEMMKTLSYNHRS
jgi:hypothetical protein